MSFISVLMPCFFTKKSSPEEIKALCLDFIEAEYDDIELIDLTKCNNTNNEFREFAIKLQNSSKYIIYSNLSPFPSSNK